MQVVFILTDNQIIDERFLVYVNDLLSTGYIADLCTPVSPAPTPSPYTKCVRCCATVSADRFLAQVRGVCVRGVREAADGLPASIGGEGGLLQ